MFSKTKQLFSFKIESFFNSRFHSFKFDEWKKKMNLASEGMDDVIKFECENFGVFGENKA